jgi:trimeric autotransporter adhesin
MKAGVMTLKSAGAGAVAPMNRAITASCALLLCLADGTAFAQLREQPGRTRTGPVVRPSPTTTTSPPPPALTLLTLSHDSISGGPGPNQPTGRVALAGPAPAGGLVVTLSSDNAAATVPPNVTIPAGAAERMFPVTTALVPAPAPVRITASAGGASVSDDLEVLLGVVSVVPEGEVPGSSAHFQRTFRVTVSGPAPAGGLSVFARLQGKEGALPSDYCSPRPTISGLAVPAGATSGVFTVTADRSLYAEWNWDLFYGSRARPQPKLIVRPAVMGLPTFPNTLVGGTTSYVTMQVSGHTPNASCAAQYPQVYNALFMRTFSSNSAVVQVPATVLVAPGESQVSFAVTTAPVTAQETATVSTITQSAGGALVPIELATITVTP